MIGSCLGHIWVSVLFRDWVRVVDDVVVVVLRVIIDVVVVIQVILWLLVRVLILETNFRGSIYYFYWYFRSGIRNIILNYFYK